MSGPETRAFVVATANFGSAARALPGGRQQSRSDAAIGFVRAPSLDAALDTLPTVVAFQEIVRTLEVQAGSPEPRIDYPGEIARGAAAGGPAADHYFLPTVTTTRYPLREKWGPRWEAGIDQMEQGMFVCAHRGAALSAPWLGAGDERRAAFKGLALDLPVLDVKDPSRFLPTRYRGHRDTEPRVATAHGLHVGGSREADAVLIDVHLTTLKAEDVGERRLQETDEVTRKVRRATAAGSLLRRLQLGVIRDFILDVAYDQLRLPVIVVGDFNAGVDAPEMASFMREASLVAAFEPTRCWNCGSPDRAIRELYTSAGRPEILAHTMSEVADLTGDAGRTDASRISAEECCASCGVPLFTHKRNFSLIDNILYTNGDAPAPPIPGGLRRRLSRDPGPNACGIRLDTSFSDHLPLWCAFRITPGAPVA